MIVGPGFVIATPTKCGTHSFEALARRVPDMEVIRPQHLMDVPEEYGELDVYMAVRDPYDRLVSMWTFICHSPNRTQWGGKLMAGSTFRQFLAWLVREQAKADEREWQMGRSPWTWTKTLNDCFIRLGESLPLTARGTVRRPSYLRIEEATAALDMLVDKYDIERPREMMYHSNRADKWRPKYRWDGPVVRLANKAGADYDARMFGYPVKTS